MHELSIARSIVETVQQNLPAGERRGVKSVKVKLGELVGISADSLAFGFQIASEGTLLHGAKLEIIHVSAVFHCRQCGKDFNGAPGFIPCPVCGGSGSEIQSGDELKVVEVEVVDELP